MAMPGCSIRTGEKAEAEKKAKKAAKKQQTSGGIQKKKPIKHVRVRKGLVVKVRGSFRGASQGADWAGQGGTQS